VYEIDPAIEKGATDVTRQTLKKNRTEPSAPLDQEQRRTQDIMQRIEDDIVSEKILPGQRLDERLLAERFGVSRTPIREALVRLSAAGLVQIRRNQGAFVTAITPARLIGILEVMAELKILAARLAARRMSIAEREKLKALRDETAVYVEKGDLKTYFEKATALHDVIYEGSHNEFLVETAQSVRTCLCAYRRYLARMHLPVKTSYEENSNLVDAIVRGDSTESEKWMRHHTELRREEMEDLITMTSQLRKLASEPADW
jgi:DNA-binding GntR family transcriptional regulator